MIHSIRKALYPLSAWLFIVMAPQMVLASTECSYDPVSESNLYQLKKECEAKDKMLYSWNCAENRCKTKVGDQRGENAQWRDLSDQCASIQVPEAKLACQKELARFFSLGQTGPVDINFQKGNGLQVILPTLTGWLIGVSMNAKDNNKCWTSSTSYYLFAAGAATLLGTELYMMHKFKKRIENMGEQYQKQFGPSSMLSSNPQAAANGQASSAHSQNQMAQFAAFEYLENEQKAVAELAHEKGNLYNIVAAAFAGASVAAIVDPFACDQVKSKDKEFIKDLFKSDEKTPQTPPGGSGTEGGGAFNLWNLSPYLENLLMPKAFADQGDTNLGLILGSSMAAFSAYNSSSVAFQMASLPYIRATVFGLASTMAYKVGELNHKAALEYQKRAEFIAMKKFQFTFEVGISECLNRDDPSGEPECYCRNADGTKRDDRKNSQICKEHYAQGLSTMELAADQNFARAGKGEIQEKGCVDLQGQFDLNCNCRKVISNKGNNACMKYSAKNIPNSIGQSNWFKTIQGATDTLNSGRNQAGLLDMNKIANAGKGALSLARKLASKNNKGDLSNETLNKLGNKELESFIHFANNKKIPKNAFALNQASNKRANAPALTQALKELGEKVPEIKEYAYENKIDESVEGKDKEVWDLNLNGNEHVQNEVLGPQGEFMDKNYNYGDSDIRKNTQTPIWKIISNRYLNTGLSRLFSE